MNFGDPLAKPGVRTYGPDAERSGESEHCRVCRVVGRACHYHRTLAEEAPPSLFTHRYCDLDEALADADAARELAETTELRW